MEKKYLPFIEEMSQYIEQINTFIKALTEIKSKIYKKLSENVHTVLCFRSQYFDNDIEEAILSIEELIVEINKIFPNTFVTDIRSYVCMVRYQLKDMKKSDIRNDYSFSARKREVEEYLKKHLEKIESSFDALISWGESEIDKLSNFKENKQSKKSDVTHNHFSFSYPRTSVGLPPYVIYDEKEKVPSPVAQ